MSRIATTLHGFSRFSTISTLTDAMPEMRRSIVCNRGPPWPQLRRCPQIIGVVRTAAAIRIDIDQGRRNHRRQIGAEAAQQPGLAGASDSVEHHDRQPHLAQTQNPFGNCPSSCYSGAMVGEPFPFRRLVISAEHLDRLASPGIVQRSIDRAAAIVAHSLTLRG